MLTAFVLAAIRFYQAALRPMMPWGCKYYPSCSHYALEAIETRGLGSGLALAARRLLRCGPGRFGGYDPVPEDCETQWQS
ncbi:MAG: membrane protein insertion efficiency factor YidD [Terriglobia bacterium]